jgi:hypothetical protein
VIGRFKQQFASGDKLDALQPTRWALFIRTDGREEVEFFEIRQNDTSIWFAKGIPFTLGESELHTLGSKTEADYIVARID